MTLCLAKRGGQCRTKVVVPHFPWASVKHKTEEAYRIYYQELFELIALRQLFGTNKSPEKTCQRGGSARAQAWTFDKLKRSDNGLYGPPERKHFRAT